MIISQGDEHALLVEVERFAGRLVEPAVARPEAPMSATTLAALLSEAESLGFAGTTAEPTGLAPWEGLGCGGAPGATLSVLTRLARSNVALAFVVHQRALARAVVRHAELDGADAEALAIAPQGRYGLGSVALARALAGAALDDDDRAVLADVYARDASRVLPLEPDFAALVTPCVDDDGALTWQLHSRTQLVATARPHAHGLDELMTAEVHTREQGTLARAPSGAARALFVEVLLAHQLGLVAISLGAVESVHRRAQRFAAQRHQGGVTIDRHAAVLGLLGRASATMHGSRAALDSMSKRPLSLAELPSVLALRARAQPALADAANDALQVFGGLGYMQETGAEKAVRDVNCLRALAGSPRELVLLVAEWERLHG